MGLGLGFSLGTSVLLLFRIAGCSFLHGQHLFRSSWQPLRPQLTLPATAPPDLLRLQAAAPLLVVAPPDLSAGCCSAAPPSARCTSADSPPAAAS
ncbi:hypothetical protein GUJ93_ZPchr0458g22422 [Zizania palustris]|uniref:Uncharacterized protein n=1 Tax=Zizania palustris TaxID=103762 RepID=A0A8J5UUS5_ZIZPA|nr:hypothetical protein GUJ93_ZPchr0458g22422 [Zizania palustris]